MSTIVRIVDVETSGLPEDEYHAICEIGWVDLEIGTGVIRDAKTFFVNPGHPMPAHTRAVHHITDQMVAAAMPPDQAVAVLLKDLKDGDILAAHKASFEQSFIDAKDRPWICTWKVSLRAWPKLISHSNQALRYELEIDADPDFDPAAAMPPHRALPDAIVTAHILRKQLAMRPIERLLEISALPGALYWCPGQKHKGKTFQEVAAIDSSYLRWIVDKSDMGEDEKWTADYWLKKVAA